MSKSINTQEWWETVLEELSISKAELRMRAREQLERLEVTPMEFVERAYVVLFNAAITGPCKASGEDSLDMPRVRRTDHVWVPSQRAKFAFLAGIKFHYHENGEVEGYVEIDAAEE